MYQRVNISRLRTIASLALILSIGGITTAKSNSIAQSVAQKALSLYDKLLVGLRSKQFNDVATKMGVEDASLHLKVADGSTASVFPYIKWVMVERFPLLFSPRPVLDFIFAHELAHTNQGNYTDITMTVDGLAAGAIIGGIFGFLDTRLAVTFAGCAEALSGFLKRAREYDADAQAVLGLQNKSGALSFFDKSVTSGYEDAFPSYVSTVCAAMLLDYIFEKTLLKLLHENTSSSSCDEEKEEVADTKPSMMVFRGASLVCSLILGAIVSETCGMNFINSSSHPTDLQRLDAIKNLNLS